MTMLDPAMDPTMDQAAMGAAPIPDLPDPAAVFAAPPPPLNPDEIPMSLLASLADPDAALGNPQRNWQHRKPSLPLTNYTPEPSEDERQKVNRVVQLFNEAKQERADMFAQWKRNYGALLNRNKIKPRRPDWLPAPEFPEILPIALTIAGWLTDQRATIDITGLSVPHSAVADYTEAMARDLKFVMEASYKANREERHIGVAATDATTYGTAIFKTTWDAWASGGLGDATFTRVSPFNFYPDPTARDTQDGNHYTEARRMTLLELDRRYPGTYELFSEGQGGGDITIDESPSREALFARTNRGPTPGALGEGTPNTTRQTGSHRMHDDMQRMVTVLECWVREHETVEIRDKRTGETTLGASDEWRVFVVANNRLVFEAHAADIFDHGKHPYDRWAFVDLGDSFWGLSLVEMLIEPQKSYNRMLASFTHNAELVGNPILKRGKGRSNEPVTNRPGQTIEVAPNDTTDPAWLEPPQLQTAMVSVLEFFLKRMEAISGLTAVVRGASPSGRNAQGVVDSVQEAAFVRIRQNLRNLEWALRGVFEKKASLICSNYTTPRMVAVSGPQSERTSITLKSGHFLIPGKDGSVPFGYQLAVDAGSQAHTSRAMREDRAVQLFTLGAIDAPALLSDMQYPNWREVAQRVEAKMAAQAMEAPGAREAQRA